MTHLLATFRGLCLVALACAALTGCARDCDGILCGACAPPLDLRVRLASGEVPTGVSVVGADVGCSEPVGAQVGCNASTLALGEHTLTVSADGVAPVTLSVTLVADGGGCCSCGYRPITREVVLGATGDAGM